MIDPIDLWISQAVVPERPTLDALASRSRLLDRRIRHRNGMEYAAGGGSILLFGAVGVTTPDALLRLACIAIVLGVVLVVRSLHVRAGSSRAKDWGAPVLQHHRTQLIRQRDALASVWRWYLAPLVPGLALFFAATWRIASKAAGTQTATAMILPLGLIALALFAAIHWLNRSAARQLSRAISTLDRQF